MTGTAPSSLANPITATVLGAGVSGLTAAVELAERGVTTTLVERADRIGAGASWYAGGMLAPWCEAADAPAEILARSEGSIDWWARHVPEVIREGSLVVAPPRDRADLQRFARRTHAHETLNAAGIARLEPMLADRFDLALFFPREAHVDPRHALEALRARFVALGGTLLLGGDATPKADWVLDCTGLDARMRVAGLRGVRGEMLLLRCPDVVLSRPVRMLHPRMPVYIVPRADHVFMVGATMVESEDRRGMTLRAMSDLLGAAYTLHPAFAEAEILETGVGLRPAYADNVPVLRRDGRRLFLNGMYRHGFLLSPEQARRAADIVTGGD